MELTWDRIQPFLSERGHLEVELAALRCQLAMQAEAAGRTDLPIDVRADPES